MTCSDRKPQISNIKNYSHFINRSVHHKKIIFIVANSVLCFSIASAGTMGDDTKRHLSGTYVTAYGGATWAVNSNDAQDFVVGASQYTYRAKSSNTSGLWGIGFGKEYLFASHKRQVLFGLAYYGYSSLPNSGFITQGVDVESSDVFSYRYHIKSQQLVIESKLLSTYFNILHPYAQIGVGVASNKATRYTVNLPGFVTFSPIYADNHHDAFTYNLDLGVDVAVASHWRMGLSYRFSDLGAISLGQGLIDNVAIHNTLQHANFYLNTLLAQVTYIV